MATGDGNGWVECRCGARHWGRHGAAGLVLLRPAPAGGDTPLLLMQLRAAWTHEGDTWGLVGGARDSHEDARAAALREAAEEAGVASHLVAVIGSQVGEDHGDWRYTYVLAVATRAIDPLPTAESAELRWVDVEQVPRLRLHSALARAWPDLAGTIRTATSSRRGAPPAPYGRRDLPTSG